MDTRGRAGSVMSKESSQFQETLITSRAREATELFKSNEKDNTGSEDAGEKSQKYRSMRLPKVISPLINDLSMEHSFNVNKRKDSFNQFFKQPSEGGHVEGETASIAALEKRSHHPGGASLEIVEDEGVHPIESEVDGLDVFADIPGSPPRVLRKATMYEVNSLDGTEGKPEKKDSVLDSPAHILTLSRRGKKTQSIVRSGRFQGSLRQMPEVAEIKTLNSLEADDAGSLTDGKSKAGRMKVRTNQFGTSSGKLLPVNTHSSGNVHQSGTVTKKTKKKKNGNNSNADATLISYATKHLRKLKDTVGL